MQLNDAPNWEHFKNIEKRDAFSTNQKKKINTAKYNVSLVNQEVKQNFSKQRVTKC